MNEQLFLVNVDFYKDLNSLPDRLSQEQLLCHKEMTEEQKEQLKEAVRLAVDNVFKRWILH